MGKNAFGRFPSRRRSKSTFSDKTFLDNNMTLLLQKKLNKNIKNNEKNVQNRKKMFFQRFQILHFQIGCVLPDSNFSMQFCQF